MDNIVYVYNKNMDLIATFDGELYGSDEDSMRNAMVAPTVHIEQNGASTLSFQMLSNSEKWQDIKDPENIYLLNGRYYTALNEGSYKYDGQDNVRIVNVTLVETWYLLAKKYVRAYNCGVYTTAKAKFSYYDNDVAVFTIKKSDCEIPGNLESVDNAWEQVKAWTPKDDDGKNWLTYYILKDEDNKPYKWENAPDGVFVSSVTVSGDTATIKVKARAATNRQQVFAYENDSKSEEVNLYSSGNGIVGYGGRPSVYATDVTKNSAVLHIKRNSATSVRLFVREMYGNKTTILDTNNFTPSSNEITYTVTGLNANTVYAYNIWDNIVDDWPQLATFTTARTAKTNNKIGTYDIEVSPLPSSINAVYVNTTVETTSTDDEGVTTHFFNTSNKRATFSYNSSTGTVTVYYAQQDNEIINSVIVDYDYYNLGNIESGATCTIAYGAEVFDEHSFIMLPKANKKYKLTIDGVKYDDSEVKDSRGLIMPRGSGGYAMWAALKNSGWSLGICDVIATGFDHTIDYGVFNVETDMNDTLYIIQAIQHLYGGILDWDSYNKILNYRAENAEDYQAYNDGFSDWKGYEFRIGKNMTEQPQVTVDNDIVTKGYVLGYGNLNIKKVNNGKSYVEDYSYTKDVYEGYLEQPLIYDTNDEGGQKQLLYWAQKEIKKKSRPRKTVDIYATDIRTVEGYEHELFDINEVVRVYYKDDEGNKEVMEEKRVILWEYNAFAMWDCTVQIGDKTQNFSEIFKLIYNMAVKDAPKTNGAGNISTSEITYQTTSKSLNDYLKEQRDKNNLSIADLITEANNNYAYSELFAQYQKSVDKMVTDAYAGLQVYADEKFAQSSLIAEYIQTDLNGFKKTTNATLNLYSDEFSAQASLIASLEDEVTKKANIAYVDAKVTDEIAKVDIVAKLNNELSPYGFGSFITVDATNGVQLGAEPYTLLTMKPGGIIKLSALADIDLSSTYSIHINPNPTGVNNSATFFSGVVDFTGAHRIDGLYAVFG